MHRWENLSDEELLRVRIRDLGLQIPGSCVEPFVQRLYDELDAKGISCHPTCYLADEWLTPDKIPTIGIPFCLAHPRLTKLEKTMMYEVEGGDADVCMKLLRHECGHALNYAYQLYRRTRWRALFGRFSDTYSNSYSYQPYSRRFVINLEDNYASPKRLPYGSGPTVLGRTSTEIGRFSGSSNTSATSCDSLPTTPLW